MAIVKTGRTKTKKNAVLTRNIELVRSVSSSKKTASKLASRALGTKP
jgi:hypothetical protein